jgi:hypothetical protein
LYLLICAQRGRRILQVSRLGGQNRQVFLGRVYGEVCWTRAEKFFARSRGQGGQKRQRGGGAGTNGTIFGSDVGDGVPQDSAPAQQSHVIAALFLEHPTLSRNYAEIILILVTASKFDFSLQHSLIILVT